MSLDRATALDALRTLACSFMGFSPDAVQPASLARALSHELRDGATPADVIAAVLRRDADLMTRLAESLSVGETYFFRHPEQFQVLAELVQSPASQERTRRAWSAGCATGEEAWSLAACLEAAALGQWTVLGTDLVGRNIRQAERGEYGSWSVRQSEQLWPAFAATEGGQVRVLPSLRPVTQFRVGNLLDAPRGDEQFDVIFCRHVLVYFSEETRARAVERLVAALAPDGVLVLASMDIDGCPAGLERTGPVEFQMYTRRATPPFEVTVPIVRDIRTAPPEPVAVASANDDADTVTEKIHKRPNPGLGEKELVERHLEALALIEQGAEDEACRALEELCHEAPAYVPGLVEHALLLHRRHAPAAGPSAERALAVVASFAPDVEVVGPEPLPAWFYLQSMTSLLTLLRGGAR